MMKKNYTQKLAKYSCILLIFEAFIKMLKDYIQYKVISFACYRLTSMKQLAR